MLKLRDAGYCNLKLLLIYCVVYGHLMESHIYDSELLLVQYRIIYMFHMPLFIFLSGLFLNSAEDCKHQIKRMLPVYALFQTAALVCGYLIKSFTVRADTPCWILWYLLSYCFWAAFGYIWFWLKRFKWKWVVLIVLILLGSLAGYVPWLDRTWSGSRTIVFFPYFFAGLICKPSIQWHKYRHLGIIAFVIAGWGIFLWGNQIPVSFLYQAAPYGILENGFALRILSYCMAVLLGFFLLTVIPGKRFPFTKAGVDTMPAYLIHAPIVLFLRKLHLPWVSYLLLSADILFVVYKIMQWSSAIYGITSVERRGRGVCISKDI